MKFTFNWLKDFVDIKITPQQLAEKLTMAGLEVSSIEEREGDFVFEVEITSNRPDWLSIVGIAREVSAITGSKLKVASIKHQAPSIKPKKESLAITIEDKKDCPLYTAKIIRDVRVGASPEWLRKRLELIGCRSINNIVDATNYILFTWGEPLHAFDLDKLSSGEIIVRRAKQGERIKTIDEQDRLLSKDVLVIADEHKPVAVAGIMGGKETEVTYTTKNILLEAAIFNPVLVRKARQLLGLQSDSAYRFERGINPEMVKAASSAVLALISSLARGSCTLEKSSKAIIKKPGEISFSIANANKILGQNIPVSRIINILTGLGFKASARGKHSLKVIVPSHRPDVSIEADLIEEVARIYGFGLIPSTIPRVSPAINVNDSQSLVSLTKNILTGLGLNEVITYSLIDKDLLAVFNEPDLSQAVEIRNPLSKEQEILRTSLIPSLAKCVAYNLNQKQECVNIFEISKGFTGQDRPKEKLMLAVALCGTKSLFVSQGLVKEGMSLSYLKGITEVLFERLGVKDFDFKASPDGADIYAGKEKIGAMFKLKKELVGKLDIKHKDVFCLEVCLERLFSFAELKKKFLASPKFPAITRDMSLIIKEGVSVKEIEAAIKDKTGPLLRSVRVADYYRGKQIPAGFLGLTISCEYRADERTLTETEVNPLHSAAGTVLTERFGATIR